MAQDVGDLIGGFSSDAVDFVEAYTGTGIAKANAQAAQAQQGSILTQTQAAIDTNKTLIIVVGLVAAAALGWALIGRR